MNALKAPAQRIRGLAIAGAVSLLATAGCGSNGPTEPARQPPNAVLTVLEGDGQEVQLATVSVTGTIVPSS